MFSTFFNTGYNLVPTLEIEPSSQSTVAYKKQYVFENIYTRKGKRKLVPDKLLSSIGTDEETQKKYVIFKKQKKFINKRNYFYRQNEKRQKEYVLQNTQDKRKRKNVNEELIQTDETTQKKYNEQVSKPTLNRFEKFTEEYRKNYAVLIESEYFNNPLIDEDSFENESYSAPVPTNQSIYNNGIMMFGSQNKRTFSETTIEEEIQNPKCLYQKK